MSLSHRYINRYGWTCQGGAELSQLIFVLILDILNTVLSVRSWQNCQVCVMSAKSGSFLCRVKEQGTGDT